jgi:hypothetical protein
MSRESGEDNISDVPSNIPEYKEISFEEMPSYMFSVLSIEYLYQYIRFYSFKEISDSQKRELFSMMGNRKLRDKSGFPKILAAIDSQNFNELEQAVRSIPVEKVDRLASAAWELVLEGYFSETKNVGLAFGLFRNLMFFPLNDKNISALEDIVNTFKKTKPENRSYLVSKYVGRAMTL